MKVGTTRSTRFGLPAAKPRADLASAERVILHTKPRREVNELHTRLLNAQLMALFVHCLLRGQAPLLPPRHL